MFWIILLVLTVAYAPCSIGLSLPVKRKWRSLIALLLFFLAIGIQATLFAGVLPRAVLIPAAWLSGVLIFSTPFFFVRDMVLLCLRLGKRRIPNQKYVIAAILAVAGALAAWGEYNAIRPPEVRRVEIESPEIPAEFDGFRMAYISDLHISRVSSPTYLWSVVCSVNKLNPDAVLLGGDLGDLKPSEIGRIMSPLSALPIHAKDGVYSSPGNHEYIRGFDEWLAFLDSIGVESLINRHVVIERGDAKLVIAGLPDMMRGHRMYAGREEPDLDKALAGAPEGAPVVLLSHQPRFAHDHAAHGGVFLQLSGHTHGGMIAGIPALLVKTANRGFVSGLYQVGGMKLYVSKGAGLWNGFMFRLGVPSEITEIVLRSPQATTKE